MMKLSCLHFPPMNAIAIGKLITRLLEIQLHQTLFFCFHSELIKEQKQEFYAKQENPWCFKEALKDHHINTIKCYQSYATSVHKLCINMQKELQKTTGLHPGDFVCPFRYVVLAIYRVHLLLHPTHFQICNLCGFHVHFASAICVGDT